MKKKIAIGSDHGGFQLKQALIPWLKEKGYEAHDFGTHSAERADYPDIAAQVAAAVSSEEYKEGILICSSGVGMSIAANRVPGVRASLCYNEKIAVHTREHNWSNVLCLGAHYTDEKSAKKITETWLATKHGTEPRYARRVEMIDENVIPRCPGCF